MRVLVLLAHPNPASFNAAIAERACRALASLGHHVTFHDLHAEHFDPVITREELRRDARLDPAIARHCEELAAAGGLVIVHPNWWGQPPAVLKGWIDRVLRPDVAYRFVGDDPGVGVPEGLLRARRALILNTSDTADEREREVFGDPLAMLWGRCMLPFCGVNDVRRHIFRTIVDSTPEQRAAWLDEVESLTREAFPAD